MEKILDKNGTDEKGNHNIQDKCTEILNWIEDHPNETAEAYEKRHDEIQSQSEINGFLNQFSSKSVHFF